MASPLSDRPTSDHLVTSGAVVVVAAKLLRTHWPELSNDDRDNVLDRLAHHAEAVVAGLVHAGGGRIGAKGDQNRIDQLEIAAEVSRQRIETLEAAALDSEAAALVSDARILELATEVERLLAVQDHASVIDQAKRALMSLMHISEDAAFAVLVAASQRDEVSLYTVAERIAASQHESSNT